MPSTDVIPHQTDTVVVADGAVPVVARRAAQGGCPGAALVVVPSLFGISDDVVPQLEALAESACIVVALDLFWRDVPGPVPYEDMPTVMARFHDLDLDRAYSDYRAVVAWARAQPGCDGRVIGLGVCFGGPFCFLGAADGLLQGVVTWHGTRLDGFLERAAEMRCPMTLHFGDRDRVVPMAAVDRVRQAFAGRDDVSVIVHEGADHGYSHPSAPTADPAATAAGVESVRRLLGDPIG